MLEILRLASPRERFLCLIVIIVLCWSVILCADEYQVTQNAREVFSKRRKVFFSDKIEIIGSTYFSQSIVFRWYAIFAFFISASNPSQYAKKIVIDEETQEKYVTIDAYRKRARTFRHRCFFEGYVIDANNPIIIWIENDILQGITIFQNTVSNTILYFSQKKKAQTIYGTVY